MKIQKKKRNSFIVTDIVDKSKDKTIDNNVKKTKTKRKVKTSAPMKISPIKTEDNSSAVEMVDTNQEICDTKNWKNDKQQKIIHPMNKFRDKCLQNRIKNGLILLSPKVEKKIYNLKKGLRNKGMDENEIKDIIRKRRREEENAFLKTNRQKCFKCRQFGHRLADCPLNGRDCEEAIDVCYRCGSSEHILSECHQKGNNLPFVKCFMCSQIGHITRDCPQNKRGIYPKGGNCKACHSVNHLIKDCPQNQRDEELENEITLTTFDGNDHSVDAELVDNVKPTFIQSNDNKKFIKF